MAKAARKDADSAREKRLAEKDAELAATKSQVDELRQTVAALQKSLTEVTVCRMDTAARDSATDFQADELRNTVATLRQALVDAKYVHAAKSAEYQAEIAAIKREAAELSNVLSDAKVAHEKEIAAMNFQVDELRRIQAATNATRVSPRSLKSLSAAAPDEDVKAKKMWDDEAFANVLISRSLDVSASPNAFEASSLHLASVSPQDRLKDVETEINRSSLHFSRTEESMHPSSSIVSIQDWAITGGSPSTLNGDHSSIDLYRSAGSQGASKYGDNVDLYASTQLAPGAVLAGLPSKYVENDLYRSRGSVPGPQTPPRRRPVRPPPTYRGAVVPLAGSHGLMGEMTHLRVHNTSTHARTCTHVHTSQLYVMTIACTLAAFAQDFHCIAGSSHSTYHIVVQFAVHVT